MCKFLIAALLSVNTVPGGAWHEHYELGLLELERGAATEAVRELETAVEKKPRPELKARTEGPRYVDYTPYLYLAVATQMMGEIPKARQYLAQAEEAGIAAQSAAGRKLLEAYRVLLRVDPLEAADTASVETSGFAEYERQPEVLSEAEYQRLQRQILSRCNLDPGTDPGGAPWYFHYELGLELAKHQDPQRAVDALVEAVARRPDSKQATRMYGMWFIDYLPYLEIAKQHTILGNRECAQDALRVSAAQGEVSPQDPEYDEYVRLKTELEDPQPR